MYWCADIKTGLLCYCNNVTLPEAKLEANVTFLPEAKLEANHI